MLRMLFGAFSGAAFTAPLSPDNASLLRKATETVEGEAVDECKQRRTDPVQGPNAAEGVSGLFQALLGQAVELPQPQMQE